MVYRANRDAVLKSLSPSPSNFTVIQMPWSSIAALPSTRHAGEPARPLPEQLLRRGRPRLRDQLHLPGMVTVAKAAPPWPMPVRGWSRPESACCRPRPSRPRPSRARLAPARTASR
jgi:hypothetical protein